MLVKLHGRDRTKLIFENITIQGDFGTRRHCIRRSHFLRSVIPPLLGVHTMSTTGKTMTAPSIQVAVHKQPVFPNVKKAPVVNVEPLARVLPVYKA